MTDLEFARERDAMRFTLRRGDELLSVLDYRDDGRTIALTRAYTVPTHRGHGYASVLVERAVTDLETEGDRAVLPVCWYVSDWFRDHPERRAILAAHS